MADPKFQLVCDHESDEKYIVLRITNDEGAVRYEIVSMPMRYHSMIVDSYDHVIAAKGEQAEIRGGGIIQVSHANKTVRTWGKSGAYGRPNVELVETILRNCKSIEGYSLDVTVTDLIRD